MAVVLEAQAQSPSHKGTTANSPSTVLISSPIETAPHRTPTSRSRLTLLPATVLPCLRLRRSYTDAEGLDKMRALHQTANAVAGGQQEQSSEVR